MKPAHEREKDKVLMEQYMQQLNDHLAKTTWIGSTSSGLKQLVNSRLGRQSENRRGNNKLVWMLTKGELREERSKAKETVSKATCGVMTIDYTCT